MVRWSDNAVCVVCSGFLTPNPAVNEHSRSAQCSTRSRASSTRRQLTVWRPRSRRCGVTLVPLCVCLFDFLCPRLAYPSRGAHQHVCSQRLNHDSCSALGCVSCGCSAAEWRAGRRATTEHQNTPLEPHLTQHNTTPPFLMSLPLDERRRATGHERGAPERRHDHQVKALVCAPLRSVRCAVRSRPRVGRWPRRGPATRRTRGSFVVAVVARRNRLAVPRGLLHAQRHAADPV